jgi:hypothetical protein
MIKKQLLHLLLLAGFILGSHNGYIALWSGDSIDPDRIYPYRVSILPEADQQALRKGIRAENILELTQLLEDYLS